MNILTDDRLPVAKPGDVLRGMCFDSSPCRFALLSVIALCGCLEASAQTNQLAHLLTTNRTGNYRLEPAWVGESKRSVATGCFATDTNLPALDQLKRDLRFDFFHYFERPLSDDSRTVSRQDNKTGEAWRFSSLHSYRDIFPTDSQLTEARTEAALTKLLGAKGAGTGASAWGDVRVMHSSAGWTFFRLKDDTTIETLSVFCFTTVTNGDPNTYVESIEIRRGTARSQK